MEAINVFQYETNEVRVVMVEGEPWFVARDVAVVLGYRDTTDAIQRHCKKANDFNAGVSPAVPSPKIIPESDVYRLIMRSNLPTAERFQDWVTEEVLPSIRKTGQYVHQPQSLGGMDLLDQFEASVKLARYERQQKELAWESARQEREYRQTVESGIAQREADAEKKYAEVRAARALQAIPIPLREFSRLIPWHDNPDLKRSHVGPQAIYHILEDAGIIYRDGPRWRPQAWTITEGYLVVDPRDYSMKPVLANFVGVMFTGTGANFLVDIIKGLGYMERDVSKDEPRTKRAPVPIIHAVK